jgi:tetratricopeptide (TPR) repeat protein
VIGNEPQNGPAHLLLCRVYFSLEQGSEAAHECDAALKNGLARDSNAQDWAGRAFGRHAEHAGPLAGLKLAGEVRTAFQRAHELDPKNPAAANDLGEFYVSAPFVVGGGVDKATDLANSIGPTLPEVAHRIRGLIAEKHNDYGTAEREFLAATNVSQSSGAFVDLGTFYLRQNRPDKGLLAARRAIAVDREMDANVVDAATTMDDAHQTGQAVPVLRAYLLRGKQSDAAPAFRVHTLLGQMLARSGDTAGARSEFQQALALASTYAPARKALGAL